MLLIRLIFILVCLFVCLFVCSCSASSAQCFRCLSGLSILDCPFAFLTFIYNIFLILIKACNDLEYINREQLIQIFLIERINKQNQTSYKIQSQNRRNRGIMAHSVLLARSIHPIFICGRIGISCFCSVYIQAVSTYKSNENH